MGLDIMLRRMRKVDRTEGIPSAGNDRKSEGGGEMKKLLIAIIGVAAFCGCDQPTTNNTKLSVTANHGDWVDIGYETYICPMKLFGHEYIITVMSCRSSHTIHAAHCPCHTNNLNRIND